MRPFSRDRAFPTAVRGPVDCWALRRFAARRAGVRVGGLRRDMSDLGAPLITDMYIRYQYRMSSEKREPSINSWLKTPKSSAGRNQVRWVTPSRGRGNVQLPLDGGRRA